MAEDGQIWTNLVTPEVSAVAQTIAEFVDVTSTIILDDNLYRFNITRGTYAVYGEKSYPLILIHQGLMCFSFTALLVTLSAK